MRISIRRLTTVCSTVIVGLSAAVVMAAPARATDPGDWLGEANYLRSFWNIPVPTLTEDPALSANAKAHNATLEDNDTCTRDGFVVQCTALGAKNDVDNWVGRTLSGEQVLNPRLTATGFDESSGHASMDTVTNSEAGAEPTETATWPNGPNFPLTHYADGSLADDERDVIADYCSDHDNTDAGELGPPLFVDVPGDGHRAFPQAPLLRDGANNEIPVCAVFPYNDFPNTPQMVTAVLIPLEPLTVGTQYTASYIADHGVEAHWSFTTAGQAPDAPTDVALAPGTHSIGVTWTAPSDDGGPVTGYDVQYRKTTDATWTSAPDAPGTDTTRTIDGLTTGVDYLVRVAARNAVGTGAYSTEAGPTHPDVDLPGAPTGIDAVAGAGKALVSWTAPTHVGSDPLAGYDVQVSRGGGAWTSASAAFHTDTAVQHTITGLTNGAAYRFRVAAISAAGTGDYGAASTAVTPRATVHLTRITTSATRGVTFGRTATLTATLFDATTGKRVGRAPLSLLASAGAGSWRWVADATTRGNGTVSIRVRPARTTQYVWTFAGTSDGTVTLRSVRGAARTVAVAATVSAKFVHAKVKVRHRVVFAGVVRPGHARDVVRLEMFAGRQWRDTGITARTSGRGKYRIAFVVAGRGRYLLRVRHAATAYHVTSVSPARRLRIT